MPTYISDQLLITKLYNSFIKVDACGKILPRGKVHGLKKNILPAKFPH